MIERIFSAVAMALIWAGAAAASGMQPAELPPDDFTAGQYIDSRGCVFLRGTDQEWRPRLYRGEEMVCGFPPTLTKRPLAIEGALDLYRPAVPPPEERIEQALGDVLFPYLREGERTSDSAPFRPLPDMGPEAVDAGPADLLQAEIAAQSAVRYAMAGARQPNRELCRWLGYDDGAALKLGAHSNGLGRDPTQGFCNNLAPSQLSRLAFVRPAQMPESQTNRPDGDLVHGAADGPAGMVQDLGGGALSGQPAPQPPVAAGPARVSKEPAAPALVAGVEKAAVATAAGGRFGQVAHHADAGMIPAHARYVRVGVFDAGDPAATATQRLFALGVPVLRQVKPAPADKVTLLSGPFTSRQTIVMALDRIRSAGFPDAVPR